MPTFTDQNSALGDLNNRVKVRCLPAMLGAFISLGAYLIARDTSGYGLWLPLSLFFGIILTTLCFWSEKEEQIKPDLTLWFHMQGIHIVLVAITFGLLSLIGDPVFAMYLDWRGSVLNP